MSGTSRYCFAVPGSAPVRANSPAMWDNVRRSARALVELIEHDVRPRDVITAGSVRNAVRTMLAHRREAVVPVFGYDRLPRGIRAVVYRIK